jgi:hypothetical protein
MVHNCNPTGPSKTTYYPIRQHPYTLPLKLGVTPSDNQIKKFK